MELIVILGIIGLTFILLAFFVCFILTFHSYRKKANNSKIFFMIWSLAVVATYTAWLLRIFLVDIAERDTTLLYPYWAVAYAMGGLSLIFLDFAVLNISSQKDSRIFKILFGIILLSFVGVVIVLIMGFKVERVLFMGVTDLIIKDQAVYYFFSGLILFYIFFPNAIFINFLIENRSDKSFTYKRVRIIELGIVLFSLGIALDGMRLPSDLGILIVRIVLLVGGLITVKGFLMKPIEN